VPSKRYVLFISDSDVSASERQLEEFFGERFGKVRAITLKGNPRAVIMKTTDDVASRLKELRDGIVVCGDLLTPALTSGAVGNLKRRAAGAEVNGEVHERGVRRSGPVGARPGPEVD
jgi:hypothetical protein